MTVFPNLGPRWKLPDLRASTYPTPPDLQARRQARPAVGAGPVAAPDVAVRNETVGGVPCVVCEPADSRGVALYLHGGGYRLGSAVNSAVFASRLASKANSTVVSVEYRLAPENPFPAGLTDAAAVYEHVVDRDGMAPLVAGDSAGGGLAASLTVAAAAGGVPLPRALILMSPWLDLTCTAATFASNAEADQLFSLRSAQEAAAMYLQGYDPSDPLVSPLRAPLDRWPPTLVMASTDEVLLDDSLSFAAVLAHSGADVECDFRSGVSHAWPSVFPDLHASRLALDWVESFVARWRD